MVVPKVVLFFGMLVLAGAASAETWVALRGETPNSILEYDRDSVAPADVYKYSVTWRLGAAERKGIIDCESLGLVVNEGEFIHSDPIIAKYEGVTVKDYVKGRRAWKGGYSSLSSWERLERYIFPSPSSASWALIKTYCATDVNYDDMNRKLADIRNEFKCATKAGSKAPICAEDSETKDLLFGLGYRFAQARKSCNISDDNAASVFRSQLLSITECNSSGQSCGVSTLMLFVSGIKDDLIKQADGQACSYLPRAIALAKEKEEQDVGIKRFQSCISPTIVRLDDGISSADAIALAVYGSCRRELPSRYASSREFEGGFMPGLTSAVLEYRRVNKAIPHQSPVKPAKPKSRAYES